MTLWLSHWVIDWTLYFIPTAPKLDSNDSEWHLFPAWMTIGACLMAHIRDKYYTSYRYMVIESLGHWLVILFHSYITQTWFKWIWMASFSSLNDLWSFSDGSYSWQILYLTSIHGHWVIESLSHWVIDWSFCFTPATPKHDWSWRHDFDRIPFYVQGLITTKQDITNNFTLRAFWIDPYRCKPSFSARAMAC